MKRRWTALLAMLSLAAASCRRAEPPLAEPLAEAFRPADTSASEDRGRRLFAEWCSDCHGAEGRGDGQNAYNLDPPPPDMSESLGALPGPRRRRIIEEGSTADGRSPLCPPFGRVLASGEIDELLAYLHWIEKAKFDSDSKTPRPAYSMTRKRYPL
ncbi:MAG: c-type cytochrome [Vicinamibacteria bacterium]|nr:c-type cytochrome [Vicinamibacteria bacterium]